MYIYMYNYMKSTPGETSYGRRNPWALSHVQIQPVLELKCYRAVMFLCENLYPNAANNTHQKYGKPFFS
jgi:hypothetical protein